MQNEPLVCVIIVNYNSDTDTKECVRSLKKANYNNVRICIVDNGSRNIGIDYNDIITSDICDIINLSSNKGFSGGNNTGIKYCKEKYNPDYFLILNNDTVVDPDFLEPLVECCKKNDKAGIITGKIFYYDDPTMIWFGGSYYDKKNGEYKFKGIGDKDN